MNERNQFKGVNSIKFHNAFSGDEVCNVTLLTSSGVITVINAGNVVIQNIAKV